MSGTLTLGNMTIPFDEEIFGAYFRDEPDLFSEALIKSGAMVEDSYIASQIAGGGNYYTIPFYGLLDYNVAPENYDGKTDITLDTISGKTQSGVVWGRAHGWTARQFAADFTAANPMQAMAVRAAKYWSLYKQKIMMGITDAVMAGNKMKPHVVTKTELEVGTIDNSIEEIFGDHASNISLAVMHSAVAQWFKDKERVENLRYTDPNGVTRQLDIYQINGVNVVLYNGGPKTAASGTGDTYKAATYTTYLLAAGSLRHASAPVTLPFEVGRDPLTNGGEDYFVNRMRETVHIDGFTFTPPTTMGDSPTDAELTAKANWSLAYDDPNAIPIATLTTPGIR